MIGDDESDIEFDDDDGDDGGSIVIYFKITT